MSEVIKEKRVDNSPTLFEIESGKSGQTADIKILSSECDGEYVVIEFLDGLKYKLQHPGNETVMLWKEENINLIKGRMNTVNLLKKQFQHCVLPEGHGKAPTIDNVKGFLGAWQDLLNRFLAWEFATAIPKSKG